MTNEKFKAGRKPVQKTWETKFSHIFRTDYANASDVHVLLFLSGDRASQLIEVALRAFAKANGIPVDDPELQESICLQSGSVIAKSKRSPSAMEVMQSIGKSAILKKLISSIDSGGQAVSNATDQTVPQRKPAPVSPPAVIEPKPIVAVAQALPITPLQPPLDSPSPVETSRPNKAPISIDMGPELEIEIDIEAEKPTDQVQTLKNRWLTNHDY